MRPVNATECPVNNADATMQFTEKDKYQYKLKLWEQQLPNPEADWNCKYLLQADQSLQSDYIYLELENYGFEEEVRVMVQPKDIENYNPNLKSQTT